MHPFIPVEPTDRPGHYRFNVPKNLCVGPPDRLFMFGGVGLASALSAVLLWGRFAFLSRRPLTPPDAAPVSPPA